MICPGRACPSASCQYLLWCKVFVTLSASQTLYVTLNQHLLSSFACKIIIKLVFYQYIKFLMVKNTLFDKYYWSTVRWNHGHQLMGHDIPSLTYFFFFSELTLALITAQNMASAQPACLCRAGCTVSVTSTGKERPVTFPIAKPTVAVLTMATVTWQERSSVSAMTAGKVSFA